MADKEQALKNTKNLEERIAEISKDGLYDISIAARMIEQAYDTANAKGFLGHYLKKKEEAIKNLREKFKTIENNVYCFEDEIIEVKNGEVDFSTPKMKDLIEEASYDEEKEPFIKKFVRKLTSNKKERSERAYRIICWILTNFPASIRTLDKSFEKLSEDKQKELMYVIKISFERAERQHRETQIDFAESEEWKSVLIEKYHIEDRNNNHTNLI